MHEPFEPKCTFCAKFVRCFGDDSPLADWGYCADDRRHAAADRRTLAEMEKAARAGDYAWLLERTSALGIYQETDDGCVRFLPRSAPPAARRSGVGPS